MIITETSIKTNVGCACCCRAGMICKHLYITTHYMHAYSGVEKAMRDMVSRNMAQQYKIALQDDSVLLPFGRQTDLFFVKSRIYGTFKVMQLFEFVAERLNFRCDKTDGCKKRIIATGLVLHLYYTRFLFVLQDVF